MASTLGNGTRTPGTPGAQLKRKLKRRRRRRSKRKEKMGGVSAFKLLRTETARAEDEDSFSTSSGEVKENRDTGNLDECPIGPRCCQSFFSPDTPRGATSGLKRKQPLEEGNGRRLRKPEPVRRKQSWSVLPKNALVHLNELRPGLQYQMLAQTGPRHAPVFSVTVEVNGLAFKGTGATKKAAKMRAAELALGSFIQFPNASQAHLTMAGAEQSPVDFTSDRAADYLGILFKEFEPSVHSDRAPELRNRQAAPQTGYKSPVALLNELRPGLRYLCLAGGAEAGRVHRRFVMALRVDGRTFEGSGRSKRLAKSQAALSALRSVFGLGLPPNWGGIGEPGRKHPHLPQGFAESIFHLVAEKYSELADSCTPLHAPHKVLAGIVMTRGLDLRRAQVVAIATGTKCLNGEYINDQGLVVNDCHAEIVARRAFLRFLYSQLELLLSKRQEDRARSIFMWREEGCQVRENVMFHMYISMSPCGDARLNSPYETTADPHRQLRPMRRCRAHLRTKVESGEGTLPGRSRQATQTWDGVLQGEPLATMSCTDKIARWNVLGLQGALLSRLVEPVYLHSLTVGSLLHVGHLSRATAQRQERLGSLAAPYRRHRPLLSCLGRSPSQQPGKPPSSSLNWTIGDTQPEVLNASRGTRAPSGAPSRLCKRALFSRWARLLHKLPGPGAGAITEPLVYGEAKQRAGLYQKVKQKWFRALHEAGLGTWVRKPPEQDHFLVCV
ncbi:double-stranded RNA-specific editase B2-like isoform X2 [Brienomyrus brachyistius]|uniref:double-stranded RNA-specific editase B2-like isoform X2 n=1 Tax=Brienomyrus brachyistius TaxID=42636 RepID=UPI0020B287D5|nr:double-stranded RNA-specific editase B2-like isoform X2 [Brienomyrus brachyistius]